MSKARAYRFVARCGGRFIAGADRLDDLLAGVRAYRQLHHYDPDVAVWEGRRLVYLFLSSMASAGVELAVGR